MIEPSSQPNTAFGRGELIVAGFALSALLVAEVSLMTDIRGTHFSSGDGRMMDAVVRAAFKFAGFLDVGTLSHIQGIGSQSLPFNVWVNPAYWPFAFIDSDLAADLGGLIALACFVFAVYVMARCFDLAPGSERDRCTNVSGAVRAA